MIRAHRLKRVFDIDIEFCRRRGESIQVIANISILQTAFGWDHAGMEAVHWTLVKLALRGLSCPDRDAYPALPTCEIWFLY